VNIVVFKKLFVNRPIKTIYLAFMIIFSFSQRSLGQNLESIGKANPLKVSGGLSVNQIFYDAVGSPSNRSPYTY
jgi:hypothetical protein